MPRPVEGSIALVPTACELCGHAAQDEPAVVIVTKDQRKPIWLCKAHTDAIGRGSSASESRTSPRIAIGTSSDRGNIGAIE